MHADERQELERISSDLVRDLKLRYLIIDNFIPEHEKTRFLRRVYYDENVEEWHFRTQSSMCESSVSSLEDSFNPNCSRPSTGVSRPNSAYGEMRRSSASSLNRSYVNTDPHMRLFHSFTVPFYKGKPDELGLYMPEPTTQKYGLNLSDGDDEDDEDDDGVQIEIMSVFINPTELNFS